MTAKPGLGRADDWLRRRPLVADLALAALLAALVAPTSVGALLDTSWPAAGRLAAGGLVLLAHAALVLRRVATGPAFAVVSLAMLVLVLSPDVDGPTAAAQGGPFPGILLPSALTFPFMLYAVAAHASRPLPLLALVTGLLGAVLTTVRLWQPGTWASEGTLSGTGLRLFIALALLASVLAPWALGRFRRVRTAYVLALEERARRAEQDRAERAAQAAADERARIAREMHDVVAHSLSVIVSQAEGGRLAAERDPGRAVPVLGTISQTGREALTEMRGLLGLLRTGPGDEAEGRAPQPVLADVQQLVATLRSSGHDASLAESGTPLDLGRAGELAAYRVVQESLTNIVKHAGPDASARVEFRWGTTGLDIDVTDDGVGPATGNGDGGHGLAGMRERVTLAGGTLEHGPGQGGGHRLHAFIPTTGEGEART